MKSLFRLILVVNCVLGQMLSAFGSPVIAYVQSANNALSSQKACCCSKAGNSCCSTGCCCSPTSEPIVNDSTSEFQILKEGIHFTWVNPVSSNRCKGTQLINDLGTDLFSESSASLVLFQSTRSSVPSFSEVAVQAYSEIKSPPPKI